MSEQNKPNMLELTKRVMLSVMGDDFSLEKVAEAANDPEELKIIATSLMKEGSNVSVGLGALIAIEIIERHLSAQERIAAALEEIANHNTGNLK